jgi:RNA polymerase sigma factor (sigma-70 family)
VSSKRDLSDAQALRRCRRDPDAICVLYDRHVARLVAALARDGGDREVAWEIAQETFARVLERPHRVKLQPEESAWPWLWVVARNLLRDQRRRDLVDAGARRRLGIRTVPFDLDAIEELIARVDAEESRVPLATALDELPAEQRKALVGRVVAGLDYATLSRRLDASEVALRARVSRGLRAVRLRLLGGRP